MKVIKTISIDVELFLDLKKRGINVSKLLNNFLKEYTGIKETSKEIRLEKAKQDILKQEAQLAEKRKVVQELEEKRAKEIEQEGVPFQFGFKN